MINMARNFGQFLDEVRSSRNITREDFTEGIISIRQYQRYISKEASINNGTLFKLCNRLNMDFFEIYQLFSKRENEMYHKVILIYQLLNSEEYVQAESLISEIDINKLYENSTLSLFAFCQISLNRKTKRISEDMAMEKLKKLIDYPNCLQNEVITLTELISLIDLSKYLIKKDEDKRVAFFLFDKIKNQDFISNTLFSSYLPSIYSALSSLLGFIEEFDKSIFIAKSGIDYCLKHDYLNSLAHLHYYLALSLMYTNRKEESLIAIRKMFSILSVEDKELKTKKFTAAFEKNFNLKITDL